LAAAAPVKPPSTVIRAPDLKVHAARSNDARGPQTATVFGDFKKKAPLGFFLKVPAGFRPGPHTHSSDYQAVVVSGRVHNFLPGGDEGTAADAGATWFQEGKALHDNHCESTSECVIFIYMPKGFDFLPGAAGK